MDQLSNTDPRPCWLCGDEDQTDWDTTVRNATEMISQYEKNHASFLIEGTNSYNDYLVKNANGYFNVFRLFTSGANSGVGGWAFSRGMSFRRLLHSALYSWKGVW